MPKQNLDGGEYLSQIILCLQIYWLKKILKKLRDTKLEAP